MKPANAMWLMAGAVTLGVAAALLQLGWEYTHGGIQRHHLLNDASLPAVSNAWGLLVMPLLGALAGWVVALRMRRQMNVLVPAAIGFLGSLAGGAALSVAFVTGGEFVAAQVMMALLVAAVVFPAYRAESLFGFVIGMTFTFGPVLPALVACVPMLIAAFSRLLLWRTARWVMRRMRPSQPA